MREADKKLKKKQKTFDNGREIWYYSQAVLNCMRSCWNWQTGMTKDHVSLRRVGSSPILRINKKMGTALDRRFLSLCMVRWHDRAGDGYKMRGEKQMKLNMKTEIKKVSAVLLVGFCMALSAAGAREASAAKQKVVAIDAGHQLRGNNAKEPNGPGSSTKKAKVTSGTSGCATKLPEYKLNLQVAKKLKKELEGRGYKVVMVRTGHNVNISNVQRAQVANRAKADAFVRIHANSASSSSVSGALTIAPTNKNRYLSKKVRGASQKLSKKVIAAFCRATGARNRGVMYTDTMTGINWCKIPVTIIEMGFMSNPAEDRKMSSASYQKKMVKGIADGIDSYLA